MSHHVPVGLTLAETLTGHLAMGATDPVAGNEQGQLAHTGFELDVSIAIDDLERFIREPEHLASLAGTVTYAPLGGTAAITHGEFNVFTVDADTNLRQMVYRVHFSDDAGQHYTLVGQKRISDDPGFDVVSDLTTLFVSVHAGDDTEGAVIAAGELLFKLADAPRMLGSMTATGTSSFTESLRAKMAFLSFACGNVRDVYLADINPLYDAAYRNLVLRGQLLDETGTVQSFFLVSGVHSPGFPWGDSECFSDIMLVLGDEAQMSQRLALTRRVIHGLELDIAGGRFRYAGKLVQLGERSELSFSEIANATHGLPMVDVEIDVDFVGVRHDLAPFPFRIQSEMLDHLATHLRETLTRILPAEALFGFHIVPYSVNAQAGTLRIRGPEENRTYSLLADRCFGEAEDTTIRNVREPTLLYGYLCAPIPSTQQTRVQFQASSLRNERESWTKDRLDVWLGALVSHFCSKQLLMDSTTLTVTDLARPDERRTSAARLRVSTPVIELSNDHFPTAIFQRRVVVAENSETERCWALEEAMQTIRCEAIGSDRRVIVASIRHPNKLQALRDAIRTAGLFAALDEKCRSLGKAREVLAIVVKPNFMFTYDKRDRTTFTDPELVEALVAELQAEGYRTVRVVEAQSTYGEYFTGREVRSVAAYLGYALDGSRGYEVVDLTEDAREIRDLGPHLGKHPVPLTWRDADFRISFAKNKTHSYAFYTLTLKNIYGALCLPNKFKEYHVCRDIYHTTIEYLKAFPVDFGIIDAHSSADGPFGIFADTEPNLTESILASRDLVAVDWIGASKMGLDPRISPYMRHAIAAFGKPGIELIGDASLYHPWLNVPHVVSLFAHCGIDANYHFGNLFYVSAAHMDADAFELKPTSTFVDVLRAAMEPIRATTFLQAGGHRTWANRLMNRIFTWLGS